MKRNLAEENRMKYTIPSGASYQYRSKNAIYVSPSNTVKHEMSKCLGAYMLQKWGDIIFDDELIGLLSSIQKKTDSLFKGVEKQKADFITEAIPKRNKDRRIDLVRLRDEVWFEFESDHKVDKGDCITIRI